MFKFCQECVLQYYLLVIEKGTNNKLKFNHLLFCFSFYRVIKLFELIYKLESGMRKILNIREVLHCKKHEYWVFFIKKQGYQVKKIGAQRKLKVMAQILKL